jgi:hypothetical protein
MDIDENNSRGGVLVVFDCLHGYIRPLLFLPLHQVGTVFFSVYQCTYSHQINPVLIGKFIKMAVSNSGLL